MGGHGVPAWERKDVKLDEKGSCLWPRVPLVADELRNPDKIVS